MISDLPSSMRERDLLTIRKAIIGLLRMQNQEHLHIKSTASAEENSVNENEYFQNAQIKYHACW